ncbi:MAG TPA: hypothetical protein VGP07_12300, partial [Polyangia bacterium]
IDEATLQGGRSVESWHQSWNAFCGPDDVLVTWGRFHMDLATVAGLRFPPRVLDLRRQAPWHWRRRVRTIEDAETALLDSGASVSAASPAIDSSRRGGARLATLVRVLTTLTQAARDALSP